MTNAQQKINDIIHDYKIMFFAEYNAFKKQQKLVQSEIINEFAGVQGDSALERRLFDMPATLYEMLIQKLNKEELKYFKSKKGARWFAKSFPQFRTPRKL